MDVWQRNEPHLSTSSSRPLEQPKTEKAGQISECSKNVVPRTVECVLVKVRQSRLQATRYDARGVVRGMEGNYLAALKNATTWTDIRFSGTTRMTCPKSARFYLNTRETHLVRQFLPAAIPTSTKARPYDLAEDHSD